MEFIDFYEINDAAWDYREECLDCEHREQDGVNSECLKLSTQDYSNCPFSEMVAFELWELYKCSNDNLLVALADELMELELNKEEVGSIKIEGFKIFVKDNFSLFEDRIKDFFVKRISDTDNYRDVI